MSLPKKRSYFYRRDEADAEFDDSDANGWAVSYSDLLMVLMSFFVLFFSFGDGNKLDEIIWSLNPNEKSQTQNQVKNAATRNPASFDAKLLDDLKTTEEYVMESKEDLLWIHLPDTMYYPGQIEIMERKKIILDDLLTKLEPFSEKIKLTIVGHSDNTPLSKTKNYYIQDNFSLSALRASRIVSDLIRRGFPSEQLYIRAGAENIRNTRSLSLQISMKGDS